MRCKGDGSFTFARSAISCAMPCASSLSTAASVDVPGAVLCEACCSFGGCGLLLLLLLLLLAAAAASGLAQAAGFPGGAFFLRVPLPKGSKLTGLPASAGFFLRSGRDLNGWDAELLSSGADEAPLGTVAAGAEDAAFDSIL